MVERLEKEAFADDRWSRSGKHVYLNYCSMKLPDLIKMIALQPTKVLLLLHNVVNYALKDELVQFSICYKVNSSQ